MLSNADRAVVDPRKLVDYCLSPLHPVGKHKATVFQAALGLKAANADLLRHRLLRAAIEGEAVFERSDEFGARYRLGFVMDTPAGQALIRSAWMIRSGEDFPRLTT